MRQSIAGESPEAVAREVFQRYVAANGLAFKELALHVARAGPLEATVRLTALLQRAGFDQWTEEEAEVEARFREGRWEAAPWLFFSLTPQERVRQQQTAEALTEGFGSEKGVIVEILSRRVETPVYGLFPVLVRITNNELVPHTVDLQVSVEFESTAPEDRFYTGSTQTIGGEYSNARLITVLPRQTFVGEAKILIYGLFKETLKAKGIVKGADINRLRLHGRITSAKAFVDGREQAVRMPP